MLKTHATYPGKETNSGMTQELRDGACCHKDKLNERQRS